MVMTRFEKRFVNRRSKADRNIDRVRNYLEVVDSDEIHDVLEIGCGTGSVSAFLAHEYKMNVIGADFDPEQIKNARCLHFENAQLKFQVEDASQLSFPDDSFDLIVSQNVFHHIPNWSVAIQEMNRVLRDDGYVFWFDLAFPRFVVNFLQSRVKNYGLYTYDEVLKEFFRNGFNQLGGMKLSDSHFAHHHLIVQNSCPR